MYIKVHRKIEINFYTMTTTKQYTCIATTANEIENDIVEHENELVYPSHVKIHGPDIVELVLNVLVQYILY
jgi:hypothetical protein